MGVAGEASGVNNEPVSTMTLCGLSICSLELLRGAFHPAVPPSRRDMTWQLAYVIWSSQHRLRRQLERLHRR